MTQQELYKRMILIRECEERIRMEYSSDEIKTPCHLAIGAEAIPVGVIHAFGEMKPKVLGTYRNHHIYFALSGEEGLDAFWGELYGKQTGCAKGKAGSMHLSSPEHGLLLTSAVVGTTIPIAVGVALANKYRGDNTPVIAFFGDGATEEGVFHESLNFASLHKLPVFFVCEDNGLAIHTHAYERQSYSMQRLTESYRWLQYRIAHGPTLDDVVKTTERLIPYLSSGPCFLHAVYHRFYEHVGVKEDFDVGYREKPLHQKGLDPIDNLKCSKLLQDVSEEQRNEIRSQVLMSIDAAVLRAKEAKFPGPEELTKDVFE